MNLDELIDRRDKLRATKQWAECDAIRDELERHLVFVFDAPWGQEVFYLTEGYFRFKNKFENTRNMTMRKYVEHRIKEDARAERLLQAFIYSNKSW